MIQELYSLDFFGWNGGYVGIYGLDRTHNGEQPKRRVGQKNKVGRILEARVGQKSEVGRILGARVGRFW